MYCIKNHLATLLVSALPLFVGGETLAQEIFGPTPYLSLEDRPDGFCAECNVEDFEDNDIDIFIGFDCGEILGPNIDDPLIPGVQITDSVDADDGEVDGSGNGGHSFFCVDPARSITVSFAEPVIAAGLVWTDGDRGVAVQIEAFDVNGGLLAKSEPEQIADDRFFGETAEDRFFGVRTDEVSIASVRITTSGAGIEVDHVTWDSSQTESSPDVDEICSAIASMDNASRFDINNDGMVDLGDLRAALNQQGSLIGDASGDGTVAFDDFLIFADNFGSDAVQFSTGDFNCDGNSNFTDFLALSTNFGATFSNEEASLVPEPSNGILSIAALIGMLLCRINRRKLV